MKLGGVMEIKRIIIYLLSVIVLISGCNTKKIKNDEIEDINLTLDSLISKQYQWLKDLDTNYITRYGWPDSIYRHGNYLINNVNKHDKSFVRSFNLYNKEFGNSYFSINGNYSNEYIITKIKLLQYHALSQEIMTYFICHFQVDMLGLMILNDTIQRGKKEQLILMPYYIYGYKQKKTQIIINNDTLEPFEFFPCQFYYNFCSTKGDTTINIDAKIRSWWWNKFFTIETSTPIYIKN
jgi:hypothetical protein